MTELSNVLAFDSLEMEIGTQGRLYSREDICVHQAGNTEIVAKGIERIVSVSLTHTQLGSLSVRALSAEPLAFDPFSI